MAIFTISPELAFDITHEYGVLTTGYGGGLVQRRAIYTDVLKRWRLQWNNLSETNKDSIMAFWAARLGSIEPFDWTPPNEVSSISVRFIEESLKWQRHTGVLFKLSFEVDELFKGTLF